MEQVTDHDGKSKTSSAVDQQHYPEVDTVKAHHPATADIAKLAHELWTKRGCPEGSHERDWAEAETELREARRARSLLENVEEKGGSVQP